METFSLFFLHDIAFVFGSVYRQKAGWWGTIKIISASKCSARLYGFFDNPFADFAAVKMEFEITDKNRLRRGARNEAKLRAHVQVRRA